MTEVIRPIAPEVLQAHMQHLEGVRPRKGMHLRCPTIVADAYQMVRVFEVYVGHGLATIELLTPSGASGKIVLAETEALLW